jgi:NAD(P) transhydrogenase subunit beta
VSGLDPGLALAYLVSAALFITGLKRLARVRTAPQGNALAATGMLVAVVATLVEIGLVSYWWLGGGLVVGAAAGVWLALTVEMTAMPELVARFNGFGGAASALVGLAVFWRGGLEGGGEAPIAALGPAVAVPIALSVLIGATTFGGSAVAEAKLRGRLSGPGRLGGSRHVINVALLVVAVAALVAALVLSSPAGAATAVLAAAAASLVFGVGLARPIGGADMPVVISLLNSLSGLAAAATGFVVTNLLLIIAGVFVGAAGLILTRIMCAAMNRSLTGVLFARFGAEAGEAGEYAHVRQADPEQAAMVLENARSVILVPGFGLAAGQAQHDLWDLAQALEARGATVTFAIHPVAGRMPGHMNVVLADADVPYDKLVEMERITPEFARTDAVVVVGANDVVNPAATTQPDSPLHGMPVLPAWEADSVFVIKRSLAPGFAGIKNELFERSNTMMLYGDAKEVLRDLTSELREATGV